MNQQNKDSLSREQYFYNAELKERERLNYLFDNYFKGRGCKDLECTAIGTYMGYDAFFTSGNTVFCEAKIRDITSLKWGDGFIEKKKFLTLYEKYKAGYYTLFFVEYKDYFFIWDLHYEFQQFENFDNPTNRHRFFTEMQATSNMYDYSPGEVTKTVRYLPYHQATYIIGKDFEPCSYKDYFKWRMTAINAITSGLIKNPDAF